MFFTGYKAGGMRKTDKRVRPNSYRERGIDKISFLSFIIVANK